MTQTQHMIEEAERSVFENWCRTAATPRLERFPAEAALVGGEYKLPIVQRCWQAWQARAAYSRLAGGGESGVCPDCDGSGRLEDYRCWRCFGTGRLPVDSAPPQREPTKTLRHPLTGDDVTVSTRTGRIIRSIKAAFNAIDPFGPSDDFPGRSENLEARLRCLVSLGPYEGYAAEQCVKSLGEAADALTAAREKIVELERDVKSARQLASSKRQSEESLEARVRELEVEKAEFNKAAFEWGTRIRELEEVLRSVKHGAEYSDELGDIIDHALSDPTPAEGAEQWVS